MLAGIARGTTTIANCNRGDDVARSIAALRALGARARWSGRELFIEGTEDLRRPARTIDCGNSGTTLRLLMGLLAGRVDARLDGDHSLRRRPMERVAAPLRAMNAEIETGPRGRAPVGIHRIEGTLAGIEYRMPVASAQLKSALLLAGLRASGVTRVISPLACRDHTERMLAAMGAPLQFTAHEAAVRSGWLRALERYEVPGDISAATFFLVAAAALPGFRLELHGVGVNPTRSAVLDALRAMGVALTVSKVRERHGEPFADIEVRGGAALRGIDIAPAAVPNLIDELPALCALAAVAEGTFCVRGAAELRVKESDRIARTVALLHSFGVGVRDAGDGIIIEGRRRLRSPQRISTAGDHRLGMTAASLAAIARAPITIDDADCIETSFPGFARAWVDAFT